jgi:hypothetical protein
MGFKSREYVGRYNNRQPLTIIIYCQSDQGGHTSCVHEINQFNAMVDSAVVKDKNALGSRIGIHLWDLGNVRTKNGKINNGWHTTCSAIKS